MTRPFDQIPADLRPFVMPTAKLAIAGLLLLQARRSGSRTLGLLGSTLGMRAGRELAPLVMAWWDGRAIGTSSAIHERSESRGDIPFDEVDEAALDSFPASDPPAFSQRGRA